jgi:hypothetical protein
VNRAQRLHALRELRQTAVVGARACLVRVLVGSTTAGVLETDGTYSGVEGLSDSAMTAAARFTPRPPAASSYAPAVRISAVNAASSSAVDWSAAARSFPSRRQHLVGRHCRARGVWTLENAVRRTHLGQRRRRSAARQSARAASSWTRRPPIAACPR